MRTLQLLILSSLLAVSGARAGDEVRMALLDFEDRTGQKADLLLGGTIDSDILASKGLFSLNKSLVGKEGYSVIDRRDFINQIEASTATDDGKPADAKPSFLHAAQALNADVVLRGQLLSFSTGKRIINQGGYKAEQTRLSMRVGLDVLDAVDGTVIGVSEGTAQMNVRQTAADTTVVGEEEALQLMSKAMDSAMPELNSSLERFMKRNEGREKIMLTIMSDADPALVEIDGILVGTTPLENFAVYKGDHVLTVGRSGYRDVTKRINFDRDSRVTVPLLRTELTADEVKDVLDKVRFNAYIGMEPGIIIDTVERSIPSP